MLEYRTRSGRKAKLEYSEGAGRNKAVNLKTLRGNLGRYAVVYQPLGRAVSCIAQKHNLSLASLGTAGQECQDSRAKHLGALLARPQLDIMGRIPNNRLRIAQSPPDMHSTQPAPSRSPTSPSSTHSQSFSNTFIQRSRPYLTDRQIEDLLPKDSQTEAKDISTRLNACSWIMQVGHSLQL